MEIRKKVCKSCEEDLPLFEFNIESHRHDGFSSKCKSCTKKARKPTELEKIRKKSVQNIENNNNIMFR